MNRKTGLCVLGVFCVILTLAVSEARAQDVTVTPAGPVIAAGATQQFTARNLTPSLVSASGLHTCARLPEGALRCWGSNEFGQLGDGTTINASTPVAVAGITNATTVSAGHQHTCALLADGTVRCWGMNRFGQLGDGSTSPEGAGVPIPVGVRGITTAVAVSSGAYHACALLANGTVWCWGYNEFGQLGDGSIASSSVPVMVTGLPAAPATVTTGAYHTCALFGDGTVRCWGRNDYGQIGDGSTPDAHTPVVVPGLSGVTALSAGGFQNCARLSDGTLRCWGQNIFGQLGDGSSLTYVFSAQLLGLTPLYSSTVPRGSHSRTPVEVDGISTASAISAGGFHTCAPLADGSTECWGRNDAGQRGDGTTDNSSTPVSVSDLDPVAAITTGGWHTCALMPDTTVRCWGWNFAGQLGDGTVRDSATTVAVTGSGPVAWTSSNTAVATIDGVTGLATARSPGSTTITATANNASGSAVLTVVP